MNTIPTIIPKKAQDLFRNIEYNLDTELYFYGSVTRSDYVPNKSDIDVSIFSDNEYSDMNKLQHILVVKKSDFHKIAWKLNNNIIYGYKVKIKDINSEISIFNNDFKEILLDEYRIPMKNHSTFIFGLLYVLKLFYYKIPLLPTQTYNELKRYIMNELMCKKESLYMLIKENKV
jgi:predicted nucleotidyltransferase